MCTRMSPEKDFNVSCFSGFFSISGAALIDWLIKWGFTEDREKGIALATDLVAAAHLQPQARSRDMASKLVLDDPKSLYKFVSKCKENDFVHVFVFMKLHKDTKRYLRIPRWACSPVPCFSTT